MAALRRLIPSLTGGSRTGRFAAGRQQTSAKGTRALKVLAAGACVTAGAAYYYRCWSSGLKGRVEAGLAQLVLPAVNASDKVTE